MDEEEEGAGGGSDTPAHLGGGGVVEPPLKRIPALPMIPTFLLIMIGFVIHQYSQYKWGSVMVRFKWVLGAKPHFPSLFYIARLHTGVI